MSKIGLIVVGVVLFALIGGVGVTRITTSEQTPDVGTLQWYAANAKAHGKTEMDFDAGWDNYAVARKLRDAIPYYSIVRVKLLGSVPDVVDSTRITTWWRFKVLETLSEQTIYNCAGCPQPPVPPLSIAPVVGELLIRKKGGTAIVDGVRLTSIDHQVPDFDSNHEYVLFLSLNASKTVGNLAMGPCGVFAVQVNGALTPVIGDRFGIWEELNSANAVSLNGLREQLRK